MSVAIDRDSRSALTKLLTDPIETGSVNSSGASKRGMRGQLRGVHVSRTLCIIGVAVLAIAARLVALSTANDLFIDEVTYTNISRSLAHGQGLTLYGQPFDLHPPAAFGLYASVIHLFGLNGSVDQTLLTLRNVSVILGTVTCVLTFLIAERAAGRWAAVVAGLLMALDPLVISYDGKVMLEAMAQCAVAAFVLCLAMATGVSAAEPEVPGVPGVPAEIDSVDPDPTVDPEPVVAPRPAVVPEIALDVRPAVGPEFADGCDGESATLPARWGWLVLAGLAAAVVLCTKETFGLVVVLTLVGLVATGWVIDRRQALVVLCMALTGYGISVTAVGLTSGFSAWWQATAGGALRLIGTKQTTGFNSPQVHVSFVSRILANVPTLGVTYLILGSGVLAALGLLLRFAPWETDRASRTVRDRVGTFVALWTLAAGAYLVYATVFGTIEAQMYYILLLPCVLTLCVWFDGIIARPGPNRFRWQAVAMVLVAGSFAFYAVAWASVHTRSDDETRRLITWQANHVAATAVVSSTDGTTQFLLTRGVIGQWNTIAELRAHHVDYVILATTLVDQGYGLADASFAAAVERQGRLVFAADGVSNGSLRVYDVRTITGGSGASSGRGQQVGTAAIPGAGHALRSSSTNGGS